MNHLHRRRLRDAFWPPKPKGLTPGFPESAPFLVRRPGYMPFSGPALMRGVYPETAFAILCRAGLALDFVVIAPAERAAALDGVVEKEVARPVEAAVLGHLLVLSFVHSVNRCSVLLLCAAAGRGRFGEVDPDVMDGGFLRAGHLFAPFPWVDKPFAARSGRGGRASGPSIGRSGSASMRWVHHRLLCSRGICRAVRFRLWGGAPLLTAPRGCLYFLSIRRPSLGHFQPPIGPWLGFQSMVVPHFGQVIL